MSTINTVIRRIGGRSCRYYSSMSSSTIPIISTGTNYSSSSSSSSKDTIVSGLFYFHPRVAVLLRLKTINTSSRSMVSVTIPVQETKTMTVPTMGDSITEGTIVEWVAKIGQAVSEDDVIAMIETDKVTIEIKATTSGVITQHFGAVDETVEVGAALYELDTEATATVESSSTISTDAPEEHAVEIPTIAVTDTDTTIITSPTTSQHRVPSIHFLGKDGWANLKKGGTNNNHNEAELASISKSTMTATTGTVPSKTGASIIIYDDERVKHPLYGRQPFTEEEMEALLLGGASVAPQVIRHSTGAKFTHYSSSQ